jgi:uncharacterized protein (TIGR02266 family)
MATPRTDSGRARRLPLDVPVHLQEGNASCLGVARDLGPGGVFVATVRMLGVGSRVTLTLKVLGDRAPVTALAEVRWCRPSVELNNLPSGVGLRFIDTPVRAAIFANELRRSREPDAA